MPTRKDLERLLRAYEHGDLPRDAFIADTIAAFPAPPSADRTAPPVPALDEDAGRLERRYQVREELGRGGHGRILAVYDQLLDRVAAMKVLTVERTDPEIHRRFVAEAQITARLEHPNVVPVHDLGQLADGSPCFVMKRVGGRSLAEVLRRRDAETYPRHRLLRALAQVCLAVEFAHDRGVVHRDLKPDNIMLGDFGEVLVMDWGIARHSVAPEPRDHGPRSTLPEEGLTPAGSVMGTPGYMAPEQARGDAEMIGPRSDVWALGAILYEILTGECPHRGKTPMATLIATVQKPVPPAREVAPEADVPEALDEVCRRALAMQPDDRLPSARALHDELEAWQAGIRERERRERAAAELVEAGRASLTRAESIEAELAQARRALAQAPPLQGTEPFEQKRRRWAVEDEVGELARARDEALDHAEGRFARAFELLPAHREARAELARFHWARFREARERNAAADAERHIRLVARYDDGAFAERLAPDVPFTLTTEPSGAEVRVRGYTSIDRVQVPDAAETLGRTPIRARLPRGRLLVEVAHADRPTVRLPLQAWQGDRIRIHLRLPTAAALGDLVLVPGGPFVRGHDPQAVMAAPSGRIHLPDFAIGRAPVSCAEYAEFLNALDPSEAARRVPREFGKPYWAPEADGRWRLPYTDPDGHAWRPDWPVVGVDADDVEAFCRWRGARDGRAYRLPTADEWEKAARGPDGRAFPWGDHFDPTFCHCRESHDGTPMLRPSASFPVDTSPYGALDMAGSVREWTSTVSADGLRVVRGGAWNLPAFLCRAATRYSSAPRQTMSSIGFRLALGQNSIE